MLFVTLYRRESPRLPMKAWIAASPLWFSGAVERWSGGKTLPDDREVLDWLLAKNLLPNKAEPGGKLATCSPSYRRVEARRSLSLGR